MCLAVVHAVYARMLFVAIEEDWAGTPDAVVAHRSIARRVVTESKVAQLCCWFAAVAACIVAFKGLLRIRGPLSVLPQQFQKFSLIVAQVLPRAAT